MLTEAIEKRNFLSFSTKAATLNSLLNHLKTATVLPLYYFSVLEWTHNPHQILTELKHRAWLEKSLVVRSSVVGEDSVSTSQAGKFKSILDVQGEASLKSAIDEVIASYDHEHADNQVLIQPFLSDVQISGVVFGRDPNTNGPYLVINYNDQSSDTTAITAGIANYRSHILHQSAPAGDESTLFAKLRALITELSTLFDTDYLDIEFAFDHQGQLYLLQVRPLVKKVPMSIPDATHQKAIDRIARRIEQGIQSHLYLYGKRTIYGVMPDWNPAEIIGIRPKPLALSLYRELVTDAVWAYQRDNYGYSNLRSFPLLVDFEGLPYIDIRVSFNSFLPKDLSPTLADQLVNYYLDRLAETPSSHDKVEFDIVFSCYTLDLKDRLGILREHGFSAHDQQTLAASLIKLTNQIIHNKNGLWKKDLDKIYELQSRQQLLFKSTLDPISKMYWIIEDCKRYGTLPFAGLARAAFIAVQILKSFISVEILTEQEYSTFLRSVHSVSSDMTLDFASLAKDDFLEKYGHLRPGTYDIMSPRYDEAPDLYFEWDHHPQKNVEQAGHVPFALSIAQLRKIQEHIDRDQLDINVLELLEFIKTAIESREYSKFVFTKSVSEYLRLLSEFAAQYGLSREDCAYINLKDLMRLYSSSVDPAEILSKSVTLGKMNHQLTTAITLPPLITQSSDAWFFDVPDCQPNFITQNQTMGPVAFVSQEKQILNGAILFIPSADPGYDWIFSHNIAGFITKYGGLNSHMAIRAGELNVPAVIGAGEKRYLEWSRAKRLHIDCSNQQVKSS